MTTTALSTTEQNTLKSLEEKIDNGIATFIEVGQALKKIKDGQLYRETHTSFQEYCEAKWGFSRSNGYHLIATSEVAKNVGVTNGVTKSHLTPLQRLTPEHQKEAWAEVQQSGVSTANDVKRICKKHMAMTQGGSVWEEAIRKQTILGQVAYDLLAALKNLPKYYKTAVEEFCLSNGGVSTATLTALRQMEWEFQQEVLDVLSAGGLDSGYEWIEMSDLSAQTVNAYAAKLRKESVVSKQLEAKKKQKMSKILDGAEIFDLDNTGDIVYLFPEDMIRPDQITKVLKEKGYDLMMIVATKGNPEINFDGHSKIRVNSMNGVKPVPIMDLIRKL